MWGAGWKLFLPGDMPVLGDMLSWLHRILSSNFSILRISYGRQRLFALQHNSCCIFCAKMQVGHDFIFLCQRQAKLYNLTLQQQAITTKQNQSIQEWKLCKVVRILRCTEVLLTLKDTCWLYFHTVLFLLGWIIVWHHHDSAHSSFNILHQWLFKKTFLSWHLIVNISLAFPFVGKKYLFGNLNEKRARQKCR